MKPQDVIFLGILVVLAILRKPIYLVWAGLLSLVLSIPLFAGWIFFTAEHLVWYAAAFFLIFTLFSFRKPDTVQ